VSREKGKRAAGTTQKIVCTANLLKVNSNRWNGATRQAVHEAFPMRRRTFWPWMLASVLLGPAGMDSRLRAEEKAIEPKQINAAITKAIPLLQKSAAGHIAQRTCFSCHHQALPVLALKTARQRGFQIDEDGFRNENRKVAR
jgi:hypothetical protein